MKLFLVGLVCVLGSGCEQQRDEDAVFRFPGGDPDRGKIAFFELNCNQCHRVSGEDLPDPTSAEYMDLSLGEGGRFVKSHEDIITAITNPQHVVDEQYAGILADMDPQGTVTSYMPNVSGKMTVRQLMDLTAFLDRAYQKLPEGYRKD